LEETAGNPTEISRITRTEGKYPNSKPTITPPN
jgi:hypothetical protein